ncbi:MAG: GTPase Era [Spirochaetia bacterium]|jgi:GTP-binding protein Era|nr:GTPase Era [Spirochaetia bacterium]
MKCGTVAIIGRPSSGKSTLVNTITEMPVSITASTPQTTRNAIRGIYTDQRGQLIFTDTPGYHLNEQKLNLKLQEVARASLEETDIIIYMLDATRPAGKEEETIASIVSSAKAPIVCCINKSDLLLPSQIDAAKAFLETHIRQAKIHIISAKEDKGIDDLLIELFALAPEGELAYPEDSYTDRPLEFRISEIIRGKTIAMVTQELPHAVYVDIADLEYNPQQEEVWVRAFIIVERESQKGIIVGKGGSTIKKIRVHSFNAIKKIFPGKQLNLDLRVKAQPKWRKNSFLLDKLIN